MPTTKPHYHVSVIDLGREVTLTAKVPESAGPEECQTTKRVCFAPTLWQCLVSSQGTSYPILDVVETQRTKRYGWIKTKDQETIPNPAVYVTHAKLKRPPQSASDFAKTDERWSVGDTWVERVGYVDLNKLIREGRVRLTNRRATKIHPKVLEGWIMGVRAGSGEWTKQYPPLS